MTEQQGIKTLTFLTSIALGVVLLYCNPIVLDYDELIGPNQVPHHELIKSGWPFAAMTFWTVCTTINTPQINWIPGGVFLDFVSAFCIVYIPICIIDRNLKRKRDK